MNRNKFSSKLFAILIATVMVLGAFALPVVQQTADVFAADHSVSDWSQLDAAVRTVNSGDTITLTGSFPAEGTIEVVGKEITIQGSGTIYSKARESYDSMFIVKSEGKLTIGDGVTLSGKIGDSGQTCPEPTTYTADKFTGTLSDDGETYNPKGFFIQVEAGGTATLNGTISDFVTSRQKDTTPRYVAPVVANGAGATFNIGTSGVIKNNLVGYIVDDAKANNDAQTIKQYVKGAGPNVPRVPNASTQQANRANFEGRPRDRNAGIDGGVPGTGITATAGAVIYKDGAQGSIDGTIDNNRADTGGIMVSGENTQVNITGNTTITNNVGVQFGGGSTAEQGGSILMTGGTMSKNVAWFGGGAVYVTENGVDWLQGRMNGDDGLHPQFDDRKDGIFFMTGGELTENTAFTRGGAILADSDGVNIQAGKLSYNMSRMLGGAMYVMGDHPKYEYTVFMTKLYVHDNAAVSGEKVARDATTKKPESAVLAEHWGDNNVQNLTWDTLNAPMQTLLQPPKQNPCSDLNTDILSGNVTGGGGGGNTDDYMDGVGAQGTGGGVWLCAYGNTVFEANEPDKVVITNNYATGAPKIGSGGYHKNLLPGDRDDANNNSNPSGHSRSGITAGSDFHADTGGKGTVVINGLTDEGVNWVNENTGEKYESTVSGGRLNLVNKNESAQPTQVAVEVVGNLARHGGGLAADGTFYFGTLASQATPGATIEVQKEWANSVAKKPITIRATVKTEDDYTATLADVPLDGEANPPASEFDTVQELAPVGNIWKGEFAFPMSVSVSKKVDENTVATKTAKLYTLVYAGEQDVEIESIGATIVTDMEIDPLTYKGRVALAAIIEAGKADDIKVVFGEPVYATTSGDFKKVEKDGDTYKVKPITISYAEFEEKENDEGVTELVECKDYIFIPAAMDLADIDYEIHSTPSYKTTIVDGEIVETTEVLYNIHLFSIPLSAPMSNDNWPLTEKYVNKDVHSDIVSFDQEFTYDIMAYVPLSATEFTITDTLVEGLEFADKDGNPSIDPWEVVQSVVVKYSNNHEVGADGTVESGAVVKTPSATPIDFIRWEKGWPEGEGYPQSWVNAWPNQGYGPQMTIDGNTNTLTILFDEKGYDSSTGKGNNPFDLQQARGRWVQVTFNARIKDEYRNLDALKALQANVDGKTTSWEEKDTEDYNKQAPNARDLTFANGDLNLVAALIDQVGKDPIIWAVEAPSRLFARSSRGDYYVTTDGKIGDSWVLIAEGTDDWTNADNRYNGRPPHANDTKSQLELTDGRLNALEDMPRVKGSTIEVAAEGPSKLFAKVKDAEDNISYYQTTARDNKTGGEWEKCVSQSDINNAISKITGDGQTIRYLDLVSEGFTINKNSKNWPVISEEEHEGMANQAQYYVAFGNGAEGTYKTNTVTVAPETTELDVVKKWADGNEWPEDIDSVTFSIYSVKAGTETPVYVKDGKVVPAGTEGATALTVVLTEDDPETDKDESKATVKDLPKLKETTYLARETKLVTSEGDDIEVEFSASDKNSGIATIATGNEVVSTTTGKFQKDAFNALRDAAGNDKPILGAEESGARLYAMTVGGEYWSTTDTTGETGWTKLTAPQNDEDVSEDAQLYRKTKDIFDGKDATVEPFDLKEIYTALNSKVEVEKYVENKVHADIVEFDKEFTYSVMGYVPEGATKVILSDELTKDLLFVESDPTKVITSVVAYTTNDHKGNGSGTVSKTEGDAFIASYPEVANGTRQEELDEADRDYKIEFAGKTIKLTLDKGFLDEVRETDKVKDADDKGFWIKMTFQAKINPNSYKDVLDKIKSDDDSTVTTADGIKWEKVTDDKTVTDGADCADDGSHAGLLNKAKYQVFVDNKGTAEHETNTVTIKPDYEKIYVQKEVYDALGNKATVWPTGLKVEIKVYKVEGENKEVADTINVTGLGKFSSKELYKLVGVSYTAEEVVVPEGYVKDETVSGTGKEDDSFIFTNRAEGPEIEKYVNKKVHAELETYDEPFTYDVMAYVPVGATKIVITDNLIPQLNLLSTKDEIIASVVYKDENDHTVESSVSGTGNKVDADKITMEEPTKTATGTAIEITIDTDKSTVEADKNLENKWIQVTFRAEIDEDFYMAVSDKLADDPDSALETLNWAHITENKPVLGGDEEHSGLLNEASYKIYLGDTPSSDYETNTVTVKPREKTLDVTVVKNWVGASKAETPSTEDFKSFLLLYAVKGTDKTDVTVKYLNKLEVVNNGDGSYTASWKALPDIDGVTYEYSEKHMSGFTTEVGTGTITNTKTREEKPEIEKYVNKAVHKDIDITEEFTYDIIAYVTKDADSVTITDTLNEVLTFAGEASDVKVVDLGEADNHKVENSIANVKVNEDATVSEAGKPIEDAVVTINGKTLTVTISNPPEDGTRGAKQAESKDEEQKTGEEEADKEESKDEEEGSDGEDHDAVESESTQGTSERRGAMNANSIDDSSDDVADAGNEDDAADAGNDDVADAGNDDADTTDNDDADTTGNDDADATGDDDADTTGNDDVDTTGNDDVDTTGNDDVDSTGNDDVDNTGNDDVNDTDDNNVDTVDPADTVDNLDDNKDEVADSDGEGDLTATSANSKKRLVVTPMRANNSRTVMLLMNVPHKAERDGELGEGEEQQNRPVDALRGHWIKVTFTAKIDGKTLEEVRAVYQTITPTDVEDRAKDNIGNAPVVSAEEHTGIPNNASYTIGVGNMVDVYGDKSNTVTVSPEEPELEKYIEKNVHEFVELDEVFTYDIIAYVPQDADKVMIFDDLNEQLQFAKAGANVKVFDIGTTNNHKTADKGAQDGESATVETEGKEITGQAKINTSGQSLEVILDNQVTVSGGAISRASDVVTNLRGHYVRVQFDAQLADGVNPASLTTVTITDNTPLDVTSAQATHEGVPNKTRYTVEVGNRGKYNCESNTVTVIPKDKKISITVSKEWDDNDDAEGIRPKEVEIQLYADGTAVEGKKLVLSESNGWKGSFEDLSFYNASGEETEYTVEELNAGEYTVTVTGDQNSGYTVCNTYKPEKPEIEKYINQAVHKDISLDEVFTYDIIAYITQDADSVVINDELNDDLQFVGGSDSVEITDLGNEDNHKVTNNIKAVKVNDDATVASAGNGAVENAKPTITGNKLTVEIKDATALRGHWVRVRFQCKIKDGKTVKDLTFAQVKADDVYKDSISNGNRETPNVGNAPVVSDEDHEGVPNTASYSITVDNKAKYEDTSNTVTVKPEAETISIPVIKTWDEYDGDDSKRPTSIKINLLANGEKVGEPLVLTADDDWKGAFDNMDKFDAEGNEITYTVEEEKVDYYYYDIILRDKTYEVINRMRPWIPNIPMTPGDIGHIKVSKTVSGEAEMDKAYDIEVKFTYTNGTTYTHQLSLKPTDDAFLFDYIPVNTKVEVREITTGYDMTCTVDGKDATEFQVEIGKTHEVVINNDKPEKPSVPEEKTPDKPKQPEKKTKKVPGTGDESTPLIWTGLLLVAGIGIVAIRRKKRG